ncbi:MAG TPA: hypothetical protein VLC48_11565, partial [Gemmatimonadota bacterium]|nr:hypothetical protein [Gemmatimonadota bacterium]
MTRQFILFLLFTALTSACETSSDGLGPNDDGEDPGGTPDVVAECAAPDPAWIWCDDFESDRLDRYFEYSDAGGSFVRQTDVGVG